MIHATLPQANIAPILGKLPQLSRGDFISEHKSYLGFNPHMEVTTESQLAEIDAALKLMGIRPYRLEIMAGVTIGTIKDLRNKKRKRPLNAGIWQKIKNVIDSPKSAKIFDVDADLMQTSFNSVKAAAAFNRMKLSDAELLSYTVTLYNHVMKYRAQGEDVSPNRSTAELIFYKNG